MINITDFLSNGVIERLLLNDNIPVEKFQEYLSYLNDNGYNELSRLEFGPRNDRDIVYTKTNIEEDKESIIEKAIYYVSDTQNLFDILCNEIKKQAEILLEEKEKGNKVYACIAIDELNRKCLAILNTDFLQDNLCLLKLEYTKYSIFAFINTLY